MLAGLPWGPVAMTLHSQCRGPGFDPWSGNESPRATPERSHAAAETAHMPQRGVKVPSASAKTRGGKVNTQLFLKKKALAG